MKVDLVRAEHGKSVPMTVITPIRPWKQWIARLLMWFLRVFATFNDVKNLEMIHFARWQVVRADTFTRVTGDETRPPDGRGFFLFTTNFNGPWDPYIDAFSFIANIRRGMNFLWGTSENFPCAWPLTPFKEYIHYYEYPVHCYYNAYPGLSVRDVARCMRLRKAFYGLRSKAEHLDAAAFAVSFRVFVDEVANDLLIDPGTGLPGYANALSGMARAEQFARGTPRAKGYERYVTVLAPIAVDPAAPAANADALRETIWNLRQEDDSPFAGSQTVHMLRLQVLDPIRTTRGGGSDRPGPGPFLLMVVELDGHAADFFDWLHDQRRELAMELFGRCAGTGSIRDGRVFFRRYLQQCRVPVHLAYSGYSHSVQEIREAARLRVALSTQIRRTQTLEGKALHDAWLPLLEPDAAQGSAVNLEA